MRYWDLASSKEKQKTAESGQPCWTAGVLMAIDAHENIYIRHVKRFRETPLKVQEMIKHCAEMDGRNCYVAIEEDPGQAGKFVSASYRSLLEGYALLTPAPTQNKVARASPLSAKAEFGKVHLVQGHWNEDFILEAESFPESKFKDQIDAAGGCYNELKNLPKIWIS
jgi:predicted phage terminase large subunit-like protein